MNVTWYSGLLPHQVARAFLSVIDCIPAPTTSMRSMVSMLRAYNAFDFAISGPVKSESREPHVYVKHSGRGPYLKPVFKTPDGNAFVRIYVTGGEVDVFMSAEYTDFR